MKIELSSSRTKIVCLIAFGAMIGAFVAPQAARATAVADVSAGELAGMQQVYDLPIPDFYNFNAGGVPYSVNNAGSIADGSFSRVGYYFELQSSAPNSPREWVWASMDTFNAAANRVGVPNAGTNIVENGTPVANLNVESNVGSIVTGTGFNGIIEFWASDYNPNGGGGFGSNDGQFDWKDSGGSTGGGHGSMQIFHITSPTTADTLFGFNGLNQSGHMGLGNQNAPQTGDTDWTFGPGAVNFTIKNLEVWVGTPTPEPASIVLFGLGAIGLLAVARRRKS